ncbi:MAG: tyrosine-type recombinase/integrase [Patescibacteria group bacterium]|nr:tyrosine-type recombinase/integrase [Patescibacteria group bacterium]
MYHVENPLESTAFQANSTPPADVEVLGEKISTIVPGFLRYSQYERSLSAQTAQKYGESLGWVVKHLGDLPVKSLDLGYVAILKQKIIDRGAGESRVSSITFALKSFLRYCKDVLELPVLDPLKIKPPKRRRREVIYLTNEEIHQFINAINFEKFWNGKSRKRCIRMDGLRFRTLVEVLLGTGMRISEALNLKRSQINIEKKEAKIIGKGGKERTVFFSERSLEWIRFYLDNRNDNIEWVFVTHSGLKWDRADISKIFKGYARRAGITKKITPHILRHTMATNLLFNGCPISHVKEILGHDRLETTCRYYLGLDKSKAKEAHGKFLNF